MKNLASPRRWLPATLIVLLTLNLSPSAHGQGRGRGQPPRQGLSLAHPAVAAVANVQNRHTPGLLRLGGVVGTATGLDANGQVVVKVFLEGAGIPGIPAALEGVPVDPEVTGAFSAFVDTTAWFPRPVPLGVSIGHPAITAGTLGCRVFTVTGEQTLYFILSNNHVLANQNNALLGDSILQPGPYDGGNINNPDHHVATLYDFVPIAFDGSANAMDAAVALTTDIDTGFATPTGDGYGAPSSTIVVEAGLEVGEPVQKYGRTTQWTHGSITSLNATVTVCYETRIVKGRLKCVKSAVFTGQVMIQGPGGASFSAGGDSGSLIVTDDSNRNPVALLFAGSDTHTIATPIDRVLSHFNVAIDDGTGGATEGTITGTVTDSCGDPLSGATVTVDLNGPSATTTTDGSYTIANVPVGLRTVTASASSSYESATKSVTVYGSGATLNFSLNGATKGTISGKVTDTSASLTPLAGATVTVDTGGSTTTAADGTYTLSEVPYGCRVVTASAPQHESQSQSLTLASESLVVNFALASTIVVPSPYATTEAAGWGGTLKDPLRLQEVYAASHFGAAPVLITALAFRLDNPAAASALRLDTSATGGNASTNSPAGQGSAPTAGRDDIRGEPLAATTLDLAVRLSTTAKQPDALSLTFASNAGPDELLVFDGLLTVDPLGGAGSSGPNPFEIVVTLTTPFYYSPAAGNLLVDIRNYSASSIQIDASNVAGDAASRVFRLTSTPDTATTAQAGDTGADVLQLRWVPPPNQPPVANAGPDQTVTDSDSNGTETVTLDGSGSYDVDGTIAAYEWKEGTTVLGTTVTINPSLSVGTHTVTLTVTDNQGAQGTDTVVVTVQSALFYESFEQGLWPQDSQNDWFQSSARKTAGSRSAEVDGKASNAAMTSSNILMPQGYSNARITFDWYIKTTLDNGEYVEFRVSTNNGSTWTQKAILRGNVDPEGVWQPRTVEVTGISQLRLQFRGNMSATDEAGNVDNVKVIAY